MVLLIREVLFDVVAFICPFPILPQIYEVRIRILFHTCLKNSSLGKNKSKAVQIGSVPLPRPIISIIATISKMQRLVFCFFFCDDLGCFLPFYERVCPSLSNKKSHIFIFSYCNYIYGEITGFHDKKTNKQTKPPAM